MRRIKSILILSLVLSTSTAYAWGEREQGIISGVVGALIIQNMVRPTPPQVYYPLY